MKKVIILSRREFNKNMRNNNLNDSNIESKTKVALISINDNFDDTDDGPHFKEDHENLRILFFDDVLEDIECNWGTAKAFTREQGEIVFDFLEKMKDRDTLIVHCHAGISRSGAVGQFAAEYYGIDYKEFRNMNPWIHPNSTVLRILKEIQNEKESKNIV